MSREGKTPESLEIGGGEITVRFGVSMPAVTIRLEMTKHDMRKGRNTGWPVSEEGFLSKHLAHYREKHCRRVPG